MSEHDVPAIRQDLLAGIDVGGTKIHIADTISTTIRRHDTTEYPDMDTVLTQYFKTMQARPARVTIAMAGPRNDHTGAISLTNGDWPVFDPREASEKYGIQFTTINDMVATTAGVLHATGIDLISLKPGHPANTVTKLVVALSTGIGAAAAVWDEHSKRHVIMAGEGGHIGFQPKNDAELEYLRYLHTKYPHASAELALSGKHGIDNLVDHHLAEDGHLAIVNAIQRARKEKQPVGAVLLEYATVGAGADQAAAKQILEQMGAMIGSVLRDLAVAYKATGGVYLTGTVALALGEYLAANTSLINRFVLEGAVHDKMLQATPIQLVTDPNIAVMGSLAFAEDL